MALDILLSNFHKAILDNDAASAMPDIKLSNRISAAQQLAIYIDGYRIRLISAIRSDYPALLGLLGDAKFDELALEYIENNPPTSFNLDRYPHNFAGFISSKIDDFAAEVATLEGAIAEVFMLPQSEPFSASDMASLKPEDITHLVLSPRATSKLLAFKYNTNEWLNLIRSGETPEESRQEDSFLYIYRHENEVVRAELSRAEYVVLQEIFSGAPLEKALENAVEQNPEFEEAIAANMQEWFSKWITSGFFTV